MSTLYNLYVGFSVVWYHIDDSCSHVFASSVSERQWIGSSWRCQKGSLQCDSPKFNAGSTWMIWISNTLVLLWCTHAWSLGLLFTRWWFKWCFSLHSSLPWRIPILTNVFQLGWNHQLDRTWRNVFARLRSKTKNYTPSNLICRYPKWRHVWGQRYLFQCPSFLVPYLSFQKGYIFKKWYKLGHVLGK